jgi:tRNA-splicing ligase RtcB
MVRDQGLGTIGRGNHFVELQRVEQIVDKRAAYTLGVRPESVILTIHSGSREVGRTLAGAWKTWSREAWPQDRKRPGIVPIAGKDCDQYIGAHNAALNYAALNRLLLGEIVLHRLRQATGEKIAAKLVCDAPHNSVTPYCGGWLHRKGAAPCLPGHPLVIPGSMGDATWLCLGLDASRMLDSASHGAGRAVSRTKIRHGTTAAVPTCVTLREERLVEEAPSAYKPVEQVIRVQENAGMLARIVKLTPILTFKA